MRHAATYLFLVAWQKNVHGRTNIAINIFTGKEKNVHFDIPRLEASIACFFFIFRAKKRRDPMVTLSGAILSFDSTALGEKKSS